jgi:hypothetical protein
LDGRQRNDLPNEVEVYLCILGGLHMKLLIRVLVVCAAQPLLIEREFAFCSDAANVEEIEKKSISYRLENIRQGHVRMYVTEENPSTETVFEITFDVHNIRQVRRCRQRGESHWLFVEKIIVTPKIYIAYHQKADITAVQINPVTNLNSPREHYGVLNIQALGMTPNGASRLHLDHVESLMNRSDRSLPMIQKDNHEGLDTWRIDYEIKIPGRKGESKASLWVAPSQGYSVVGYYHHADQDGKRYSTIINTQMKQYPEKNVWYPYRLIKILKEDDRILNRQEAIVEEARFGCPIDENTFTPAGLDLQPGQEVLDSTSGVPWAKIWDGKKLVDPSAVKTKDPSAIKTNPPNPERHRRPRWLQLTFAAGLGLIAAFYFWRAFRRRRSASHTGA